MATAEPFRTLGFSAVDWIETFCVHGPGDVQGQPVELDDEFAAFILKAYRVNGRGQRVVRRAFLSRSKGRSKSGLAAFIEDFEALGPCRFDHWAEAGEVSYWGYEYDEGEPVGRPLTYVEILNVATEEGQAGNTYDAVYYTLNPETCAQALLDHFGKIDVGLTRINLPDNRGYIEPVTASNESKDGGKSTFIVADETHLWIPPVKGKHKLGKMHQTMVRNLLKRKVASGWMLETSTMYAEGEGSVAEGTHAYAEQLARAGRDDGKLLFDHRQASEDWDLSKRSQRLKALAEAYGPAAAWMDLQAIADYWDDPQATHAEFRRFWLNQPVPTVEPVVASVFPPGSWEAAALDEGERPAPACIGVAVSIDRAFTSIGSLGVWDDGTFLVGAVDRWRGIAGVVAEVARIQATHGCGVVLDGKGPGADLIQPLRDAGVPITVISSEEYVQACATFYDGVRDQVVTHMADTELEAAVAVAATRQAGDGRWAWGRNKSLGDISMLEAVTLAWFGRDLAYDLADSVL